MCERLHQYLYNAQFTLLSDHLPLETIFGSSSAKLPVQLEQLNFGLQPYRLTFEHLVGKHTHWTTTADIHWINQMMQRMQ